MAVFPVIHFGFVELALIVPDILVVAAQVFALLCGTRLIAVFKVCDRFAGLTCLGVSLPS